MITVVSRPNLKADLPVGSANRFHYPDLSNPLSYHQYDRGQHHHRGNDKGYNHAGLAGTVGAGNQTADGRKFVLRRHNIRHGRVQIPLSSFATTLTSPALSAVTVTVVAPLIL